MSESDLLARARGYTPDWHPASRTPGRAVVQVFARYMELLRARLAQAPDRSFLAFLDMLGAELSPAQAARAALVFSLMEDSPVDVTLPEHSQVAAARPPLPPSRTRAAAEPPGAGQPILFSTEQTITLARGRLAALYSIDPGRDQFADHSTRQSGHFTLFDDMVATEHALYLGHDELFALAGDITVILAFSLASAERPDDDAPALESAPSRRPRGATARQLRWEYLTETGWLPLVSLPEDDTTAGLRHDGQFTLRRECGPNAKQETFAGRKSFWLRGRLATPLSPRERSADPLPVINDIRASVRFGKTGLLPDAAFNDGISLDPTKDFYPFGPQPATYAAFYVASREVFQRKGASAVLELTLSQAGGVQSKPLVLAWEYYDGAAWSPLSVQPDVDSEDAFLFTGNGRVSFRCPEGWAELSVGGTRNYWLRVRLAQGDYGYPARLSLPPTRTISKVSADRRVISVDGNEGYTGGESVVLTTSAGGTPLTVTIANKQGVNDLVLDTAITGTADYAGGTVASSGATPPALLPSTLRPPVVSSLTLGYSYLSDPEPLDHCLARNDFVFEDHTEACRWPDQVFVPLRPVNDRQPAVHLGFTRALPAGLVSLLVLVPESADEDEGEGNASPYVWEYRSVAGWNELGVLDETMGFRRSGLVQFVGPPDAVVAPGLGGDLFRVRARLKPGERTRPHQVAGCWINAVWASHSVPIDREPLGTSDGNPGQAFRCQRAPVLSDEKLEVQEWIGRGEHWRAFVDGVPDDDLRYERDRATNDITAVWVRWHRRVHLYDSGPFDRHYTVESARGLVRFGDGRNGLVPPVGRRVALTYRSGGGVAGNVPAGAIRELRMAVPFVTGETNPMAAAGGAEVESAESIRARGPQHLRHRSRAVSRQDIEWVARDASPEVARARCLPLTGEAGHAQRGWATVLIVPRSLDARPSPSPELRRRVREYLAARVVAALAPHVRILGPRYLPVSVEVECVPLRAGQAAEVEERLREALNAFLHPLTGGVRGRGWEFGEAVHVSQIAHVVRGVEGLDYARHIALIVEGRVFDETVPVDVNTLVASGEHQLRLLVGVA